MDTQELKRAFCYLRYRPAEAELWEQHCLPVSLGMRTDCVVLSIFGIFLANTRDCDGTADPGKKFHDCPHCPSPCPRNPQQDSAMGGGRRSTYGTVR